ncbi:unnamed protein product, partial [Polarella glacialis]
ECSAEPEASPKSRPRLVIATPEWVQLRRHSASLCIEKLRFVAVDEADAVLCRGMGDEGKPRQADDMVREFELRKTPPQIFLTMAHLSDAREKELVLRFPHAQRVGHVGVLVPTLRQCFHYFRGDKDAKLLWILETAKEDEDLCDGSTLVFCATAETAERVRSVLAEAAPSHKPKALHEATSLEQRAEAVQGFLSGETKLLVSTDSAARGLDFPRLQHVVMYDVPPDVTAFVHCAGRTARRGSSGLVTCLVEAHEVEKYEFDFKSHHALSPAVQLNFPTPEGTSFSSEAKEAPSGVARGRGRSQGYRRR